MKYTIRNAHDKSKNNFYIVYNGGDDSEELITLDHLKEIYNAENMWGDKLIPEGAMKTLVTNCKVTAEVEHCINVFNIPNKDTKTEFYKIAKRLKNILA